MPQLDPTWFASQLFWLAISFVMLYALLSCVILPRLQGVLHTRGQTLSSDLNAAKQMAAEADEAKQVYERALADARARAQQMQNDVALAYKEKSDTSAKAMEAKVADMLTTAERRIHAKKQELMQSLIPASAEIASLVIGKLTNQSPSHEAIHAAVSSVASKLQQG